LRINDEDDNDVAVNASFVAGNSSSSKHAVEIKDVGLVIVMIVVE
jgi:hypothetical protein